MCFQVQNYPFKLCLLRKIKSFGCVGALTTQPVDDISLGQAEHLRNPENLFLSSVYNVLIPGSDIYSYIEPCMAGSYAHIF